VTEDQARVLAETNTMVKMIYDRLPSFATCERVDAVEEKAQHAYDKAASVHNEIAEHIKNHEAVSVNRNLILGSYLGSLAGIGALIMAIFKKGGGP
jgi:hypothetical protein